jgi:predicted lysophospholipase L1 biosynthesis ABC-type transport system permease subunit
MSGRETSPGGGAQEPVTHCDSCRILRRLAVLAALLAVAVLGQFIVVSGRRRRRDFAIFKALGMLRRQISAITAWQVSTLT